MAAPPSRGGRAISPVGTRGGPFPAAGSSHTTSTRSIDCPPDGETRTVLAPACRAIAIGSDADQAAHPVNGSATCTAAPPFTRTSALPASSPK